MQKVDGVQEVKVSLKEGLTGLDLKPANHVTLAKLREVIKNNGFVSKDAQVTARGSVAAAGFIVSGTGEHLPLLPNPKRSGEDRWQFTSPQDR